MKVTMGKFHYDDDDSCWWWGTTSTKSDTVGGPSHYEFSSTSFSEKRIMSNSVLVASTSTSPSTTRRIVSLWLAIALSLLCFTSSSNYYCAATTENNLQYKEYWYKTEQLCPDLQESVAGKDIDTANYPYKSVFRFMDHLQSVSEHFADLPCILEANGPQRQVSTALIEAIHVDTRPWNYSRAQTCEEHIKLRLPEPTFLKRSSSVPQIICRIRKSKSGSKEATGSLYHPYVWQFQKDKKLGLSFSSFNLSHLIQPTESTVTNMTLLPTSDPSGDNSTQNQQHQQKRTAAVVGKNYWLEPDPSGHQFVQIVFSTRFGRTCNVRVQQYMVDSDKTLCEGVQQRSPFRLCGLYDCSEKESILRALGFWSHRKDHEQLDFLLQAEIPRWRREDPTYLEILVSTLRALIMPLLFLSVFYVTRRLRLKLANRHYLSSSRSSGLDRHRSVLRQRQCYLRSLMRDGGGNTYMNSSSSDTSSAEHMLRPSLILNHVVYDIPVSGAGDYPPYDDLPPPYESVVDPPTYFESTANVKTNSTTIPTQSHPSSSPDRSPPPPVATTSSSAAHSPPSPNTMPVSNSHRHHHHHSSHSSIIDEEMVQLISPLPLVPPPPSATASSTSSSSPPPPHHSSHLST